MNRITIDENDPRLTAFALGEMPADEAAEFETQIDGDASIRAAIDEIRQTAAMLQTEFAAELATASRPWRPSPGLSDANRRAMERRMLHDDVDDAPAPIPISRGRWINRLVLSAAGLAAAACLAIAFILPMQPTRNRSDEFAVNQKDKESMGRKGQDDREKQIDQFMQVTGQTAAFDISDAGRSRELSALAAAPALGDSPMGERGAQEQNSANLHSAITLGQEVQPVPGPVALPSLAELVEKSETDSATGSKKEESPDMPASGIAGGGGGSAGAARKDAGDDKSKTGETSFVPRDSSDADSPARQLKTDELGKSTSSAGNPTQTSASPMSPPPKLADGLTRSGFDGSEWIDRTRSGYDYGGGAPPDEGGRLNENDQSTAGGAPAERKALTESGESKVDISGLTQTIQATPPPVPSAQGTAGDGGGGGASRGLGRDPALQAAGGQRAARQPAPGNNRYEFTPTEASMQALRQQIDSLSPDQARNALAQVVDALARAVDQDQANRLRLCQRILSERVRILGPNTENYKLIRDNPFVRPIGQDALSTFGADVDTASYSNIRRFIEQQGQLPPRDAVRIEEMINYFTYAYEPPTQDHPGAAPFSTNVEINAAPWNPTHRLVRVGLRGKEVRQDMRPPTSLVFLIDVSGSMQPANKLPLVKQSLHLLLDRLNGDDMLGIVTYAGNAGKPLDSTYVNDQSKATIRGIIDGLSAGGSTNGAGGLVMAYDVATQHFIKGGVNRVILCTDGDFNVGVSGEGQLIRLIEEQRKSGVFLSVMGFGTGNLQDAKMEGLANNGNGTFAYIDGLDEARKVFVDQMAGTMVTIAKDVKFQVEFNPAKVAAYRLIGYENRKLAAQDFNNDRKDAGDIGAGHTVTALYEVVPHGVSYEVPGVVDELKYQQPAAKPEPVAEPAAPASDELLTVKLRYKEPDGDASKLLEIPVKDTGDGPEKASPDFMFASSVAAFGMILRESPYRGSADMPSVLDWAQSGRGDDSNGYRTEFIRMVERARQIAPPPQVIPMQQ